MSDIAATAEGPRSVAIGLAVAVAVAGFGYVLAYTIGQGLLGMESPPISPVIVAILIGVLLAAFAPLPTSWQQGFKVCTTTILRTGIVLLGLRLSLTQAGAIGLYAVPLIAICVGTALIGVRLLAKLLDVDPTLAALIAVGTSICGCTAIIATAPLIQAKPQQVSYALTMVALIGMAALLVYPFLAHFLFDGDAVLAGYFLGTAIHDTSQVAGAGLMYQSQFESPEALDVSTVTKLIRNTGMVLVIPLASAWIQRQRESNMEPSGRPFYLPMFIAGFVVAVSLRSVGDLGESAFGVVSREHWQLLVEYAGRAAAVLLTVAMAGIGLSTSLSAVKSIGKRPMALGLLAAAMVATVSATSIWTFGRWLA